MLFISCDVAHRTGRNMTEKMIFLFIFSLLIEILQYFIPSRHFSLLDLMANLTGLSVAYFVTNLLTKKQVDK